MIAGQSLVLTPMVQQALKILQLPTLELANMVNQELAENPMLEEGVESDEPEFQPEAEAVEPPVANSDRTEEVNLDEGNGEASADLEQERWDKDLWNLVGSDYEIPKHDKEKFSDYTEPQVASQPTLEEHLLWQYRLICKDDQEYRLGELIIGNLDERGFLSASLEEVAREAGTDTEAVADVLADIQSLDPVGVAARDVKESLLIQLRHLPERNPLAEIIVEKHLLALERHQLDQIVRAEKAAREKVVEAAKIISGLDPYPGRHELSGTIQYVIPDVVIEKHDDQYVILINDDALPELKISRTYRQLMERGGKLSPETKQYLDEKMQRARWLIRSIDQRRKTLYRVTETILEVQMDFFEKGVEHLRPLTLKEIADRVGLHESTISRVTSQKYAQTPRGLFELKYFFSSQIKTTDGSGISSTSVKASLHELVAQEDSKRPLSDQKLVAMLGQQGYTLARRTVAKYREELKILPASQRRRLD